jgi:transcription elongation GreA/GreB family factor
MTTLTGLPLPPLPPRPSRRSSVPLLLTTEGRAALTDHLHRMYTRDIPEAHAVLWDHDRDPRALAEFDRLCEQAQRLQQILNLAGDLPEPADRTRVGLGTRVKVRTPEGETLWVRLVHPEEAWLDDERISADSPLATALIGARAGDSVIVAGPSGTWVCGVVSLGRRRTLVGPPRR